MGIILENKLYFEIKYSVVYGNRRMIAYVQLL